MTAYLLKTKDGLYVSNIFGKPMLGRFRAFNFAYIPFRELYRIILNKLSGMDYRWEKAIRVKAKIDSSLI